MKFWKTIWLLWLSLLNQWCNNQEFKWKIPVDWNNEKVIWSQLSELMTQSPKPTDTVVFDNTAIVDSILQIIQLDDSYVFSLDEFISLFETTPSEIPQYSLLKIWEYRCIVMIWWVNGAWADFMTGTVVFDPNDLSNVHDEMVNGIQNMIQWVSTMDWWNSKWKTHVRQYLKALSKVEIGEFFKVVLEQEIWHLKKWNMWSELWSERVSVDWWIASVFYFFWKFQTFTLDYFDREKSSKFRYDIQPNEFVEGERWYEGVYWWYIHALYSTHPNLFKNMRKLYADTWTLNMNLLLEYWTENPTFLNDVRWELVNNNYIINEESWVE